MHKMNPAGIIALDLDGTLLNSRKELSRGNLQMLEKAADAGFVIVPATGRFYDAVPDEVKKLAFIRYAITINGAGVQDFTKNKVIYRAELPIEQAVSIMSELDHFPVIYDCYMENRAFMTVGQKTRINEIIADPHYREMFHRLRCPVPELKAYITEYDREDAGIQKIQFFTSEPAVRSRLMEELPKKYADLAVSSAHPQNVEINQSRANKGDALRALAMYLGIPMERTFAFGDGLNDLSMLAAAGVGVAMGNGCEEVKAIADYVTADCDKDGVGRAIGKLCLGE